MKDSTVNNSQLSNDTLPASLAEYIEYICGSADRGPIIPPAIITLSIGFVFFGIFINLIEIIMPQLRFIERIKRGSE